jgi:hypothetical protein
MTNETAIQDACTAITQTIDGKGADSPIIAERHLGENLRAVRGLSIYMPPFRNPSDFYGELDFANQTHWAEFLSAYLQ